ncbi:hypothetical protein [Leptospira harrisiae]|uniref:Lipoprotein n=1 Tax=Leptospira harrisiae TaxID=2023189 RepID=A0A2N0AFH2_9LEPT|nr:hypothetical protein [Leptospira harrisiae]PJZ83042.1 hypothetical protein CH364_18400 [Leptospira harrisiae]PKA06554.1 hypothetical protein CH366_18710 [Leptospira harrisiae]
MNKLNKFVTLALAFCMALVFLSCEQEDGNDNSTTFLGLLTVSQVMADATKRCETVIDSSYVSGSYSPLCTPSAGQGRFFRIEGMKALGDNGYFYLFLGYSAAPTSATPAATGQYLFVAGKSVSSPNPYVWFRNLEYGNYQGGQAASGANPTNFSLATEQELCVSFSGTSSAPTTYLWVTGVGGANCKVTGTLQKENAIVNYAAWPTPGNVIPTGSQAYFRFSNLSLITGTKITVSSESVL